MSGLIRCRVWSVLFRSSVSMEKKVNFLFTPPGSEASSIAEDLDEIKVKIQNFIPVLTEDKHKGSCGRIGIIGGSLEYTGAPYFAGMAAMRLGADLVHVFCTKDAAVPIKSYSPELMVHPILDASDVVKVIEPWLQNLHVLVIGPGLGRSSVSLNNAGLIITFCKNKKKSPSLPLVIDADGLHLITENRDLIKDYPGPVILTPNANEFSKLTSKVQINSNSELAAYFNAVIVKKGPQDIIHNGLLMKMLSVPPEEAVMVCEEPGSYRRCGGQGDILAGFIGTFVAWYEISLRDKKPNYNFPPELSSHSNKLLWKTYFKGYSYAAYGGCLMTRNCSSLGYRKFGRSLTTGDMIGLIGGVFADCFNQ